MAQFAATVIFMACLGSAAAAVLIAAARFLSVPVDNRADAVLAVLPVANCGACGYSGCAAAAEAVVKGKSGPDVCLIGSDEVTKAVASIIGKDTEATDRKLAFVCCSRNTAEAGARFYLSGPADCRSAVMLYGAEKICSGGCIGYGTCVKACPVEAIKMHNNLPHIDADRCTGCGLCVKICPKRIIALVERTAEAIEKKRCAEYCVNKNLKFEVDSKKCIKCGICFKNCPVNAIVWEKGKTAILDKDRCIGCYTCMRLCPPKAIG